MVLQLKSDNCILKATISQFGKDWNNYVCIQSQCALKDYIGEFMNKAAGMSCTIAALLAWQCVEYEDSP